MDVLDWIQNQSGYSVKLVREEIESRSLPNGTREFQESKWVPSKVNVFVWRASIDCIPCKSALLYRKIIHNDSCPLCNTVVQTPNHLLANSYWASKIWDGVFSWCNIPKQSVNTIKDILEMTENSNMVGSKKNVVYAIFLMSFWCFWKNRNDVFFSIVQKDIASILGDIKTLSFL